LGPTFDGLTRLSRSLNERNDSLGELLKDGRRRDRNPVGAQPAGQHADPQRQRSARGARPAPAGDREPAGNTSAVAQQLSGLVHDNEAKLAPALEKINSVTAMLEKSRTT